MSFCTLLVCILPESPICGLIDGTRLCGINTQKNQVAEIQPEYSNPTKHRQVHCQSIFTSPQTQILCCS